MSQLETRPAAALEPPFCRLFDYWRSRHRDGQLPTRGDIDPLAIPVADLPHILLLETTDGGRRFRYRLIGTAFAHLSGFGATGRHVDEIYLHTSYAEQLQSMLRLILTLGRPLYVESEIYFQHAAIPRLARRMGLPLRENDRHPPMVLGMQFWGDHGHSELSIPWAEALRAETVKMSIIDGGRAAASPSP